jgi:hypothetical protein
VNPIERSESKPSATTGVFATLRASVLGKGTRAPTANAAGAFLLTLCATLGAVALTTTPALAAQAPTIVSAKSSGETTTTANLEAQVNPGGEAAGYTFEYGPSASYGSSVSGSIPAGSAEVPLEREITGLNDNTEYHWRLTVKNTTGSVTSVDHTFVYATEAAGLPDGRQYELVTPPEKNGASVGTLFGSSVGGGQQVAADGTRVMSYALQCLVGAQSCIPVKEHTQGIPVEFERGSSGWVAHPLGPPTTIFRAHELTTDGEMM